MQYDEMIALHASGPHKTTVSYWSSNYGAANHPVFSDTLKWIPKCDASDIRDLLGLHPSESSVRTRSK